MFRNDTPIGQHKSNRNGADATVQEKLHWQEEQKMTEENPQPWIRMTWILLIS